MTTPGITTLGTIRATAQQRADMVNSNFITTAEWNGYLNASYYELYDVLIQHYGDDYFVTTPYAFSTSGSGQLYALPADFYKMLGLDVQLSGGLAGQWFSVSSFEFAERNKYNLMTATVGYHYAHLRYRVVGSNIFLAPLPESGLNFQLWYVPRLTALVNDSDTLDGVSGWEEYVVVDTVIKALAKEESDTAVFERQKAGLLQRIESAAANRDAGQAPTVSDVRHANLYEEPEW
jgi:hypothetical protein